uniref:Odorant receptor n=1 Tax=Conogethes pinicolalis TaxID=1178461 RepID=A0A5B9G9Z3_9NEOP|nr:odorant receptor 16 [Conogethes pinicolalis]
MWQSARKFGLEHCDLETMLENVNLLMRTLTLNIDSQNKKPIPWVYYLVTLVLGLCYYYVFLFCMVWVVACRSRQTGDWLSATIVASLGIASEIGTTKLLYMMLYICQIRELVDLYRECNKMVSPESRFADNLLKTLKVVKKRAIFFWMVLIGNGVVYICRPFLRPGRHLLEDNFIIYGFEPKFESPYYEITNLLLSSGTVFAVYIPSNISAFLIIITGYTEAQMIALSEEMLNLWDEAQRNYQPRAADFTTSSVLIQSREAKWQEYKVKNAIVNDYVRSHLREIIKMHRANINIVQKIESVYRNLNAAEFILLTFGITVELLGGLENTYLQIPFALMQVAMDCYCGQKVMDASVVFEKAVYACQWENFDVDNMKTVLVMLQMSQKTMRLSAGGVTMLSFTSLASVIRIIYSGYTALRQVY